MSRLTSLRRRPPLWLCGTIIREILTEVEIEELARFDEHWRVILADDNAMLVRSLAKRGYLDVLKRRVPLYRLNDLGREALRLTS